MIEVIQNHLKEQVLTPELRDGIDKISHTLEQGSEDE